MTSTPTVARRLWNAIEPIHATVYFAPEPADAMRALGLRSWWMGYVAGRVAPLGAVPLETVAATFFGFASRRLGGAVPDAWTFTDPETVMSARLAAVQASLVRLLGADGQRTVAAAAEPLWQAVEACRFDGRALAAAWSAVPRPDDPLLSAWLAMTVLREHRGDGHVMVAVALGLQGLDAIVTHAATGAISRELVQKGRGWSDDEWERSRRRLQLEGVLDRDGRLTKQGGALRRELEDTTDRLASAPLERLGEAGVERLVESLAPVSRHIFDIGLLPEPNPIGVPRP
jgi:hypothetical protein